MATDKKCKLPPQEEISSPSNKRAKTYRLPNALLIRASRGPYFEFVSVKKDAPLNKWIDTQSIEGMPTFDELYEKDIMLFACEEGMMRQLPMNVNANPFFPEH